MVGGMFSAAVVGPIVELHGRVNANVSVNLVQQYAGPTAIVSQSARNFQGTQCPPPHLHPDLQQITAAV